MRHSLLLGLPAGLLAGTALRWLRTRHLVRASEGVGPGVRTDDGVLLHVEVDDPEDGGEEGGHPGVTVVLCHGFAAREEMYRTQREVLRGRARVVVFDQRGHHESGWAGRRSLTMDRLGKDLGTVVDHVARPGPVVLVGHSLGALAIVALADARPELFGRTVTGVALLSGTTGGLLRTLLPDRLADVLLATGTARLALSFVWLVAPVVDLLRPVEHRWGARLLRRGLYGTRPVDDRTRETARDMWLSTSQSKAAAMYPAVLLFDRGEAPPALRDVPTLVLAGTADATIPAEHSRRMAEQIGPRAHLHLVEGAGHMVPMTHPRTVDEELLALLERVEQDQGRSGRSADDRSREGAAGAGGTG